MTADPLTILERGIATYGSTPDYARDALLTRLLRMTAPVLEEREKLQDFLPAGWAWLDEHQDADDYEERVDKWLTKLHRYEKIESTLATFPALVSASPAPGQSVSESPQPPIKRLVTSLAQPP